MRTRQLLLVLGLSLASLTMTAQTATYFMDGVATRHTQNPAFDSERNYISIPGAGQSGIGFNGNTRIDNFIMPRTVDGTLKTVTFLHPAVAQSDLDFPERNKLTASFNAQLLGVGFHARGGFTTVSVNLRKEAGMNLPGEMFTMMKELKNRDYNVGDGDIYARAWGEVGIGHSRQVNKHFRLGAKVKFLWGMTSGKASFKDLRLNLESPEQWTVSGQAQVDVSHKGFAWGTPQTKTYKTTGESYECVDFNNVEWGPRKVSLSGGGVAFDLGMEYKFKGLLNGLELSAAVTDLGFIGWDNTKRAGNMGQPFTFDGFHDIRVKGHEGDIPFRDQKNQLLDDMAQFYTVQADKSKMTVTPLGATLNVGVAYAMPFYKRLKVGLLSTSRLMKPCRWNEERLSLNLQPVDFLEMSVSASTGTLGKSWGAVVNVKPKGFNLFVGMDHYIGKLGKPCVPLGNSADVYVGMNVTFGKKR